MEAVATFLEMGGYARFVWPALGVAAVVMIALALQSVRDLRARNTALMELQKELPGHGAKEE